MTDEPDVQVRYPAARGAIRIGDYVPSETYRVHADEAARLVRVKGFEYVDATADDTDPSNEE